MAHDGGFFFFEMLHHGQNVPNQELHVVLFLAFGFITLVVAAHINGDDLMIFCQRLHLVPPRVPVIRESMDHHHQ